MAHDRKPSPCRASGVGVPVRSLHAGGSDAASAPKRHTYGPQRASELVTGSSPRGLGRGADLPVVRSGSGHVAASVSFNSSTLRFLIRDANAVRSAREELRNPESNVGPSAKNDRRPTASELHDAFGAARGIYAAGFLMVALGVLASPVWGHYAIAIVAAWMGAK